MEPIDNTNKESVFSANVISTANYIAHNPDKGIKLNTPIELGLPDIYAAHGVFILGELSLFALLQDLLLQETSPYKIEPALSSAMLSQPESDSWDIVPGDFMVLCGLWSDSFFHWMLEWLPQVIIAELAGFTGTYIVHGKPAFILESLNLLGIPQSRIQVRQRLHWVPERLFIVSNFRAEDLGKYPALVNILRNKLLDGARRTKGNQQLDQYKRVYLARHAPKRPRHVVNEEPLEKLLSNYSFSSIEAENNTLAEQILNVSHAKMFISAHGAGMLHTLFMQPESLVIELFSPLYINSCVLPIAKLLGHRYHMVPSYIEDQYPYGHDIHAYLGVIEFILQKELGMNQPVIG